MQDKGNLMNVSLYQLILCHKLGVFQDLGINYYSPLRVQFIYNQESNALKRSGSLTYSMNVLRVCHLQDHNPERNPPKNRSRRHQSGSEVTENTPVCLTVSHAMRDALDIQGFAAWQAVTKQKTSCFLSNLKRRKHKVHSLIK